MSADLNASPAGIIEALREKVDALNAELGLGPRTLTFGYIGNVGVDRRGPYDDRSWRVFMPARPDVIGPRYARSAGGFKTTDLALMLANFDEAIAPVVRRMMAEGKP